MSSLLGWIVPEFATVVGLVFDSNAEEKRGRAVFFLE